MSLITLDEANKRAANLRRNRQFVPNGIECPECGHELVDDDPARVKTIPNPQLGTHCRRCNWSGHRRI